MWITRRVQILVLVCDLNEGVTGDPALLVDLPKECVPALWLVLRPHGLQQLGDNRLRRLRRLKHHAVLQRKVRQEILEGLAVVEGDLRLTDLTTVSPVVTKVEGSGSPV